MSGPTPVRAPIGPAEVAEAAEVSSSLCQTTLNHEITSAEVSGARLRKWISAVESLSPDTIPCPDYRLAEWAGTLSRALAFLSTFGPQAEALGWTAPRLFGVHPEAGIIRPDACGGLVLPLGGAVRAITDTEIRFDHLTYRTKPGQPEGVPVWGFGR